MAKSAKPKTPKRATTSSKATSKGAIRRKKTAKPSTPGPTQEQIAARAYQLYLERIGGNDIDDWLRAEAELSKGRRK